MDDELVDAALLADCLHEMDEVLPFVQVVHSQSALYRDRNVDCLYHLLAYLCHELWREHQLCAKASVDRLLTGTPAVEIDFIVTPRLNNLGCLCHLSGILTSDLTDNRMLILCEVQQLLIARLFYVDDGMLVDHLSIQEGMLGQHSHEKAVVVVCHVDHRGDGNSLLQRVNG